MRPLQTDLSVFAKFKFKRPPVGVKYLYHKPDDVRPLEKQLALCEMLVEAQKSDAPFYFTSGNEICFGKQALGMMGDKSPPFAGSGELGTRLGIFQDARANKNLARQHSLLEKGTVNYVVMAPLDRITFEPDLLVLMATARQAEIVLRAMAYSTGDLYESRTSTVLSCSWLLVYPYLTGKLNYQLTGLGFGSIAREVFEPGWVLVSIPYNWLPVLVRNLEEMPWVPKAYTLGREKFIAWEAAVRQEMVRDLQNP